MKDILIKLLLPERGNQSPINLIPQAVTREASSLFSVWVLSLLNNNKKINYKKTQKEENDTFNTS